MIDIPAVKKQYGFENVFKAISLVTNWITTDENAQVHGIKLIFDCTNLTMQHATTMFGPENASKLLNYYEVRSRPRGYKTFFMLNSTEHEISTAHKN